MAAVRILAATTQSTLRWASVLLLAVSAVFLGSFRQVSSQPPTPNPGWPAEGAPSIGQLNAVSLSDQEATGQNVVALRIVGNDSVNDDRVISYLRTRQDREFDPETIEADKRRLIRSGLFREVRVYRQRVQQGIVVTFEVFERPTIRYLRFLGDRGLSERALLRESGLKVGDALNLYAIQEGRRKIEDFYRTRGFPKAQVAIAEGTNPQDRGVVFDISEGPLQRIRSVSFVGNSVASDGRLKTQIESKPGYLGYLFRGKVDVNKIEEDVQRLTGYYRNLGYFRARIGRELEYDESQQWLTLRFIIDEGPRYIVRNVAVIGNDRFDSDLLVSRLQLQSGQYFNQDEMQADRNKLLDLYGGQGHIFADIQADPRYLLEEEGKLDLVYRIDEGQQFRVGRINVHIAGEFPHTKESVIRNRLSVRTGDIVDIREVRASERRLKSSQLFENDPANGKAPRIVIRPPQLDDAESLAEARGGTLRGQSPDEVTLDIYLPVVAPETQTPRPHGW